MNQAHKGNQDYLRELSIFHYQMRSEILLIKYFKLLESIHFMNVGEIEIHTKVKET